MANPGEVPDDDRSESQQSVVRPLSAGLIGLRYALVLLVVTAGIVGLSGVAASQVGTLDVVDMSTNSPVTEGEPLVVEALLVCNVLEFGCGQVVELLVDDTVRDSVPVELGSNERTVVEFRWETVDGDAGDYVATVLPESGRSDEANVRVTEDANFVVGIESTTSPVVEGDRLTVTATVTNTGGAPGTQTVDLVVGDRVRDSTTVTLGVNDSRTVTLTWQTGADDIGRHTAVVESDDTSAQTVVRVVEPASFLVEIASTSSPVVAGDQLVVRVTVTNVGGAAGTRTVDLVVGDRVRDSITLTLDETESQRVRLVWETTPTDAGDHVVTVESDDDSDSDEVVVDDPANFAVVVDTRPISATAGDPVDIEATVTNTGDVPGTREVVLAVDGRAEDSVRLTLAGGASETVTLTWDTGTEDASERHLAVVSTADGNASVEVTVRAPARFDVAIQSSPATVTVGEPFTVVSRVRNTGDEAGSQEIVLRFDGEQKNSTEVTLDGRESQTVSLSWVPTGEEVTGRHEVSVASADDDDVSEITVEAGETPSPTDTETPTVVPPNGLFQVDPRMVAGVGGGVLLLMLFAFRGDLARVWNSIRPGKSRSEPVDNDDEDDEDDEDDRLNAIITVVPETPAPSRPVLFDGSLSFDPERPDEILDYSWTIEDRNWTAARFLHVFPTAGEPEVTLTVRNSHGESGTATQTVSVEETGGVLELDEVHPGASGTEQSGSLGEYVVFENTGNGSLALAGWTVNDATEEDGQIAKGTHTFEFGAETELAPGATVTLHTGTEPADWDESTQTPREQHLFWGEEASVWHPDGGVLVVEDDNEVPVIINRYEPRDGEYPTEDVFRYDDAVEWFEDVLLTSLAR
jgi:hypothetical protein